MMCPDCKEKLDRFVDRELTTTEMLEVQLHLEGSIEPVLLLFLEGRSYQVQSRRTCRRPD